MAVRWGNMIEGANDVTGVCGGTQCQHSADVNARIAVMAAGIDPTQLSTFGTVSGTPPVSGNGKGREI